LPYSFSKKKLKHDFDGKKALKLIVDKTFFEKSAVICCTFQKKGGIIGE